MSLEKFRKVFSLLPEGERKLTIVVVKEKSLTWEQCYIEIRKGTKLGEGAQEKLEELDII